MRTRGHGGGGGVGGGGRGGGSGGGGGGQPMGELSRPTTARRRERAPF